MSHFSLASSPARAAPTPSASNSLGTSASRNGSSASRCGTVSVTHPTTNPSDSGGAAPADRVNAAAMYQNAHSPSEARMRSATRRATSARHSAGRCDVTASRAAQSRA
ncbi:hypothetical protein LUX39_11655 [Actinomadura madurae]|nr:hypothetical protein [Actinomadura madurae]MCQ0014337.1 hypothetical protein [Actinomadura madurae]